MLSNDQEFDPEHILHSQEEQLDTLEHFGIFSILLTLIRRGYFRRLKTFKLIDYKKISLLKSKRKILLRLHVPDYVMFAP